MDGGEGRGRLLSGLGAIRGGQALWTEGRGRQVYGIVMMRGEGPVLGEKGRRGIARQRCPTSPSPPAQRTAAALSIGRACPL